MGTLNLSRDSTYRESVAVSTRSAIRKARVQIAQGASVVDVGAESSTARAARVQADEQIARLLPVITEIAVETVVSVETYEPRVVEACLKSGARVLNMTGREHEMAMLALAAEYDAGSGDVLRRAPPTCATIGRVDLAADPIPALASDHFGERLETARRHGVDNVVIDPGMGFYYDNLTDPMTRATAPGEGADALVPAPDTGRTGVQRAAACVRPLRGGVPYGGGVLRGAGRARRHPPVPHPRGRARARRTHLDGGVYVEPVSRGGRARSRGLPAGCARSSGAGSRRCPRSIRSTRSSRYQRSTGSSRV